LSVLSIITLGAAKTFTRKTAFAGGAVPLPGTPGQSAYQLAVQQGFSGTLDEWLESFRGSVDIQFMTKQEIQDILTKL